MQLVLNLLKLFFLLTKVIYTWTTQYAFHAFLTSPVFSRHNSNLPFHGISLTIHVRVRSCLQKYLSVSVTTLPSWIPNKQQPKRKRRLIAGVNPIAEVNRTRLHTELWDRSNWDFDRVGFYCKACCFFFFFLFSKVVYTCK